MWYIFLNRHSEANTRQKYLIDDNPCNTTCFKLLMALRALQALAFYYHKNRRGVTMRLKRDVNFEDFMQAVSKCKNDVYFCTTASDVLNLKSMLARLIFATLVQNENLLYSSNVVCQDRDDIPLVLPFCMAE